MAFWKVLSASRASCSCASPVQSLSERVSLGSLWLLSMTLVRQPQWSLCSQSVAGWRMGALSCHQRAFATDWVNYTTATHGGGENFIYFLKGVF